MFFILSKTIGILLLPANSLIGLGLIGIVLLATRLAPLGRKLLVVSVLLLAICGFSPLGYALLYPLESRFPPWDAAWWGYLSGGCLATHKHAEQQNKAFVSHEISRPSILAFHSEDERTDFLLPSSFR